VKNSDLRIDRGKLTRARACIRDWAQGGMPLALDEK
jgi:hypothetical protein